VAQYLAEAYRPSRSARTLAADAARVREAAAAAGRVRLLRTIYVPDDELCFYVFESETNGLVDDATLWASLGVDRVQPMIAIDES
jgi:hypothetical protein